MAPLRGEWRNAHACRGSLSGIAEPILRDSYIHRKLSQEIIVDKSVINIKNII
jgi:hypothetical protein